MRPKTRLVFAIQVVEHNGETHLVEDEPSGRPSVYRSERRAKDAAEFWRDGLGDEVQTVSVIRYSLRAAGAARGSEDPR